LSESITNSRVLVLSRNYPNNVTELLGLWVQSQIRQMAEVCRVKVISPVPYCPPLPRIPENYARFRRVERHSWDGGVEVWHPRFFIGPGYSTHQIESFFYHAAIQKLVAGLQRNFPFDLIHAHCTYPDGVVAAHLGRHYGVPVVITEQNPWEVWMDRYPGVRRKAIWAARQSLCHIAISEAVRKSIETYAGKMPQLRVIPDGVDGAVFRLPEDGAARIPNQILFVGAIRPVKGVDILLRAVRLLADRRRDVRLVIIGEAFFGKYRQEELRVRKMAGELNLGERVRFAGKQPVEELVRQMQRSAALVLPSRAESLGMVLVESLACGTPVVSTRCGGPEDIVNEDVGVLVPPGDPESMAAGIERVLDQPGDYDPAKLRAHALEKFGLESVGDRLAEVYVQAMRQYRNVPAPGIPKVMGGSLAG
jgi:glycosyltransferase involved in cell wall biosynthesis